ncbi:DNA-binding MarR family transcriptional regulator [Actinocorallia herbida]|uniref:DNA-binding MarR family transcriptional regulator n=1 Tax=Actinocorallia herbida TaxID=58109 RepID=A0A3N1D1L6_9ACTN|nr:MarR family winged helix-turn-helix transcriptional regulator [Actinocorallia herbida]ROO87402.1 DNA-binding MarR family transcriptional regulator [Actinocorallia herbida]
MDDAISVIEYETLLLGRHRSGRTLRPSDLPCLDRSAFAVLSRIQAEGPMSIRRLSEVFGLDLSTINRQTNSMIRSGLLAHANDPEGGIARLLCLTPEGERRLSGERAANIRGLERVLLPWSSDDISAFAEYLRRFNSDVESLANRPFPAPVTAAPTGGS